MNSADQQTPREKFLIESYGDVVPLAEICKRYFNYSPAYARQQAALSRLPVPAFKLTESTKSPWFVRVADLARLIDQSADQAQQCWQHSQI